MRRIKNLHLITGLNIGGAEMMVYKTVTNIDKSRFEPIVVSLIPPGEVGEMIKAKGIKVYDLGMQKGSLSLSPLYKLMKITRSFKPDIIHSYMFHADVFGRIVGKLMSVPVIISSIRNENIGGATRELILKLTDHLVDKTTAVCKVAGDAQVKKGTTQAKKMQVIYNGIELEEYNGITNKEIIDLKKELGILDFNKTVITIGRLDIQKNHHLLIESFNEVVKQRNDVVLLIVGDGPLRKEILSLITYYKLEKNVLLIGKRKDVPKLLSLSDLMVLSSSWEGMPNVIIEAMAARKPVVATNVGGAPEVVSHSKTGYLVEPNNINELAKYINFALNLPLEDLKSLGNNAHSIVEENFTIEKTIEETQNMYINLLGSRN